jgi:glycosyltransferase involved in cell wall biosynthesis
MRLTLLIPAINAEAELARVLPELRDIGDELVIGIDDTTTDATAEVARQFTDRIFPVPHEGFRGRGRPDDLNAIECILPECKGDWLMWIAQDETLSPLWHDKAYVNRLLDDRPATQYWIPRRLVVPPGDRFVCSANFFPDYQLRLYRNIPSLIRYNRRPHEHPRIHGERRFLTDSWILHWDAIWYSDDRRRQKIEFYRELGYTENEVGFVSFTDGTFAYRTRPLNYAFPSPSASITDANLADSPFAAAIEVLDCPEVMAAGKNEPVLIAIKNCSNRRLCPSSLFVRPANVLLSYHWYTETREIYQWDNEREDLPRPLAPGEVASYFFSVRAPQEPGNYFFQPDLVEEHVAWFSSHGLMPVQPVRVT